MSAPKLTELQRQQITHWFTAEKCTVDAALQRAKERGWPVSRSTIGTLRPRSDASAPSPVRGDEGQKPQDILQGVEHELLNLVQHIQAVRKMLD